MAVGTTEIGSGAWPYDCAPQREVAGEVGEQAFATTHI
jgi:hypothetical protein